MKYYETFLKLNYSPNTRWNNQMQEAVNKFFENASTYTEDVMEEKNFGKMDFENIKCRVTSLVDAKTGQRINDDYKKIIFPDLKYQPSLGTRYKFDNNIWITFSTDNIKTPTSNVYLKRCNNTMGFEDKYNNVYYEPCCIDYKVTEDQLFRESSIDIPKGRIYVQCQLNERTKDVKLNDRFIFGTEVYKIRNKSNFDRRYTYENNSCRMLSFYADYDNVGNDDRIDLGIADYRVYNYTINTIDTIKNVIGFTDKIDYTITCNDNEVFDEEIVWESSNSNVATINSATGIYEFLSLGECIFIGRMKNKMDTFVQIAITVLAEVEDEYITVINPTINYIKLNQTLKYDIYEYKNGFKTDTSFTFTAFGLSSKYYNMTYTNNTFSITNYKQSSEQLTISCLNLRSNEITTILIDLGGII